MDQKPNQFEKRRSLLDTNPKPLKCSLIKKDALPSAKANEPKPNQLKPKGPRRWVLASALAVGSLATITTLYIWYNPDHGDKTAYQNNSENTANADASHFVLKEDALPEESLSPIPTTDSTNQALKLSHQTEDESVKTKPVDTKKDAPSNPEETPNPTPDEPQPPEEPKDEPTEPTHGEKPKSNAPEWNALMIYRPGDRVSYGGEE